MKRKRHSGGDGGGGREESEMLSNLNLHMQYETFEKHKYTVRISFFRRCPRPFFGLQLLLRLFPLFLLQILRRLHRIVCLASPATTTDVNLPKKTPEKTLVLPLPRSFFDLHSPIQTRIRAALLQHTHTRTIIISLVFKKKK